MVVIVVIILLCWLWPRLSTSAIAVSVLCELAWSIYFLLLSLRTFSLLTGSAFSLSLYLRVLSLLDISASLWQEMQDKDLLICTVWQTVQYGRMKYTIEKWIIYHIDNIFFYQTFYIYKYSCKIKWMSYGVTDVSYGVTWKTSHTIWHSVTLYDILIS